MLCDLLCPYLGMHQTLEAFACWQRNESCSLSPAPSSCSRTGLQQDTTFGAFRADLADLQQLPRTTSPARHPGFTCPLKATTLSGTGNRAGQGPFQTRRLRQSLCKGTSPLGLCKLTQNVGLYSLKIKHPLKEKSCWYVNYDKRSWSGNWTCELNLHFKGIYSYILVHSLDLRY